MYATVIGAHEAARVVAGATGVTAAARPDQFIDQVIAEYLRQALCSLSRGGQPVYVTRLTNTVRRHLAPLWPELYVFRERLPSVEEQKLEGDIQPDRVRRLLDALSDLRDFIELDGGYWLPTLVRFVTVPRSRRVLLIGGLSTAELRRTFHVDVQLAGFARVVLEESIPGMVWSDPSRWQSYAAWCGEAPSDLKEWTEECITKARGRLMKSASDFSAFEVYAPWLRPGQPQFVRWLRFEDFLVDMRTAPREPLLCRSVSQRFHGPRRYWLGFVGPKGLEREAPLPFDQARRLMYGMDLLYRAPTRAVWEDGKTLILRNRLPPEEQRILAAIGRETSPQPGRLPLRLEIGPDWCQFVNERLNGLGIEIVTR